MDNFKTYQLKAYGNIYTIKLHIERYYNNNLAINLYAYDEDFKTYTPFASLTVNISRIPINCACIDTNNCPWAEKFIMDNELGLPLDKSLSPLSSFCTYPIYQFDIDKLCAENNCENFYI